MNVMKSFIRMTQRFNSNTEKLVRTNPFIYLSIVNCRVPSQVVSHWPVTAETQVCTWVIPCGICGGQSRTGTGFSFNFLVFPCQYHSALALHANISSKDEQLVAMVKGHHLTLSA
jgi:hypothetical protein